ncbi:MAG: hypothetical protein E7A81_04925 [Clostridiales bacterium]|nr:hypothetical protein [Clostridiales bacterium]MDU0939605.1 hypothetical protein [Clostridiales bacterium]MDU1042528.1 hypothetical protein [Clostridiales bacterium]MDU3490727.1 hypothetical protein [Clostridiales bacterium]
MKDKQTLILEKLEEIVNIAKKNNMAIDENTIKEVFADVELDNNQLSMIEDYMVSRAITVGDRTPEDPALAVAPDTELVGQISTDLLYYANEEDDMLLEDLLTHLLAEAEEWIIPYEKKGVIKEDLIQECALILSEYILGREFLAQGDLVLQECDSDKLDELADSIIRTSLEKCRAVMEKMTQESDDFKKTASVVVDQVNHVNDSAISYKEEYGIKPTPEELAKYLDVTEDYILDTMQMSGYLIETIDFDTPINNVKEIK